MPTASTRGPAVSQAMAIRLVYGMAASAFALTSVLYYATFNRSDFYNINWQAFLGIGILTFICEQVQIHIVIRRQTITFNLIEIPLIFTLFLLPPLVFLAFRMTVEAVNYVAREPIPRIKRILNLAVHALEPAIITFVFRGLHAGAPTSARTWAIILLATIISNTVSAGMVTLAIALVQGKISSGALYQIFQSIFFASLFNTSIALIMLITLGVNSLSIVLLVVVIAVIVGGYRMYTRISRQHTILNKVHEFTKVIGTARQDGNLADSLLGRVRELLDAASATLWLPAQGRHPELLLVAKEDSPGLVDDPHGENDPLRQYALDTGTTLSFGTTQRASALTEVNSSLKQALLARGDKDVIVVPLRSGNAVIGCIEVANRLGEMSTFGPEEVQLLETLAAHAAVAVENSRLVDRLRHEAYHDGLTGLANRRRFTEALETAISVAPAPGEVVAVMQFDVESLRDVNETLGYSAGDRMLFEVGGRMTSTAPDGALVARLGGDEFAVLLRTTDADAALAEALALQYSLVEPLRIDQITLDVGVTAGIAVCPEHGTDSATLLKRADVATHSAKHSPRSIQLYRPAMESRVLHRLSLVSELRRAIDEDSLSVYYQPKVALENRELLGMECLVRWEHPEHGLVPPDDFIPVAEHTGLVGALTRSVLRTALRQCQQWREQGHMLGVSVNLSPRSLHDPNFPVELAEMLRESGLPPEQLTLEILESGMIGEADRPMPTLSKLATLGVRLSVDDFGTGYSSLAYLRHLPVNEIKIDKSFVLGMATDSGDLGIVRAIVDLGRHLGMSVVAEGVESEMTLTLLEEIGCDIAQGFLFSRPLPRERIEAWMQARTEVELPSDPVPGDAPRRLRVLSG